MSGDDDRKEILTVMGANLPWEQKDVLYLGEDIERYRITVDYLGYLVEMGFLDASTAKNAARWVEWWFSHIRGAVSFNKIVTNTAPEAKLGAITDLKGVRVKDFSELYKCDNIRRVRNNPLKVRDMCRQCDNYDLEEERPKQSCPIGPSIEALLRDVIFEPTEHNFDLIVPEIVELEIMGKKVEKLKWLYNIEKMFYSLEEQFNEIMNPEPRRLKDINEDEIANNPMMARRKEVMEETEKSAVEMKSRLGREQRRKHEKKKEDSKDMKRIMPTSPFMRLRRKRRKDT